MLPALVPSLSYDGLEIADGDTASAALEALLFAPPVELDARARAKLRRDLLAYCRRDTEGLVALAKQLRDLAEARA